MKRSRPMRLAIACLFLVPALAAAAEIPVASTSPAPAAVTAAPAASTAPAAPAPGPAPAPAAARFDADAATASYMARLSPEARAKSDAYFEGGYWLLVWDFLVGLLLAWLFLGTGLSRGLRDRFERLTRFKWLQTALYAASYIAIATLVLLPWDAYEGYFREHQYGMSNQDFGAWFGEQMKELAITLVLGTLAATVIYAVLRRAPRTWWLWGALVTIGLAMFAVAIAPVYLEPVFNDIKPLADSPLKQEILSLARAQEIPATDVFEYDASKQTKRMSAHVSGILGTTRISMNDNLMTRGSHEEIKAVLGHEMGHYVLNHVYKGITFIGILIVVGFAFVRWSFEKLRASSAARWGIRDVGDVAGMPLLLFLLSAYFFVLTPVDNTITRTMEAEADNYGLNASREPDGFAQAALHLSEYRKMEPGPIEEFVFYDHPSGWNRIHRSRVWKAEHV
ncbi:MAG TPA: M48 family metallopeptidase, partial [Thermoanaerobaculia bacterium]|nr:M48 family metallopeptidase [Thermoanaerobaculia bacterium]